MKKISLESLSLRILYYQYKEYLTFIIIIAVSLLLLFIFIIPLIQDFFSIKAEEERYRQKNAILKSNVLLINQLDSTILDSQFQIATLTIATKKDYVGVVNSLSVAAEKSGVTLGDFSFEIGDLSTNSARLTQAPILSLDISVTGNINSIHSFINTLYIHLPLAKVTTFQLTGNSGLIHTEFPYKPYVEGTLDLTQKFTPFSAQEQKLLTNIQEWYDNVQGLGLLLPVIDSVPTSSPSAEVQPIVEPTVEVSTASASPSAQ